MDELQVKFLGIGLKYLVRMLEIHEKHNKEDGDIVNAIRFSNDAAEARVLLGKFCELFPEHVPPVD